MVDPSDPTQEEYIQFHFTTLRDNAPRIMEESISQLEAAQKGDLGVDGSSVPGYASVNHSDVSIVPDMNTICNLHYEEMKSAIVFCNVHDSATGKPHGSCPRSVLQKVIDTARSMDFTAVMFSELEFYVLKDGSFHDQAGYLEGPPKDKGGPFRRTLADLVSNLGVKVKRIHHENGPGQQEIEYQLMPAMHNADSTLLGIWCCHLIANSMGLEVEYDPKPYPDLIGNGLHMHIMLCDADGNNVMFDAKDEQHLSIHAKQFIAGLLKYSAEITALFARSPSSFKRLVPGHEAPVYKTWDFSNRTALVRVPHISPANLPKKQRVEFRAGDASGNPHLLAAAIYYAGLKGIMEELDPVSNFTQNPDSMTEEELKEAGIEKLPQSLQECNEILRTSAFVRELLSEQAIDFLIAENEKKL
ncbi:hypothetical protein P9112_014163 [Eukaryota sp. TZLM1-RC]